MNSPITPVTILLPVDLAASAKSAGLLESDRVANILDRALNRKLFWESHAARMATCSDEPMSMEEIQAEVDAVRAERRERVKAELEASSQRGKPQCQL